MPRPFDLISTITGNVFDAGDGWHGGYIGWDERTEKYGTLYYTLAGEEFSLLLIDINRAYPLVHWEMSFRRALEGLRVGKAEAADIAQRFAKHAHRGLKGHCYYSNIAILPDQRDTDPDYARFAVQLGDPFGGWVPQCALLGGG